MKKVSDESLRVFKQKIVLWDKTLIVLWVKLMDMGVTQLLTI